MRYANFLKDNGSIGFAAPSFGCSIEPYKGAFTKALEVFKSKGFTTVLGPNCYEGKGIGISNTPELCGEELTDMYCREDSDVLISCGGGELMCTAVPFIDFDRIKKAPAKWFMGYSDNTNFTFLLPTLADTATIYGPCVAPFCIDPWQESTADAFALLQGKKLSFSGYDKWEKEELPRVNNEYQPYNLTEKRVLFANCDEATFEGRLIGGCLDCLQTLCGTEFDKTTEFSDRYADDGIIWFLEACDLNPMGISRAMWQLKNSGWFRHVKAFLIGRPYCYGQEFIGLDHHRAFLNIIEGFDVPVIMDLDIGHLPPMMPIISGGYAKVQYKAQDITLTYRLK